MQCLNCIIKSDDNLKKKILWQKQAFIFSNSSEDESTAILLEVHYNAPVPLSVCWPQPQ